MSLKDISNKQDEMMPPPQSVTPAPTSSTSSFVEEFNENNFVNYLLKHNEPLVSLGILDSLLESSDLLLLNSQEPPPTQAKENGASCKDEKKIMPEKPKRRKSTPVISLSARVATQQEPTSTKLKSKPVKRTASSALFDKENMPSKKIKLESKEIVDENRALQEELPFECFECKKVLSSNYNMLRHLKTIHNKTEKDIVKLTKPHVKHVENLKLTDNLQACEFCAKSFKRENTLLAHIKSFHLNGIANKN
jgi:hypothetical protein